MSNGRGARLPAEDEEWGDPPWALVFPGLTERRAKAILDLAERAGLSEDGEALSPLYHLSIGMDRVTAQWLRAAISREDSLVLDPAGRSLEMITPDEARDRIGAIIDLLDDFVERAGEYPNGSLD